MSEESQLDKIINEICEEIKRMWDKDKHLLPGVDWHDYVEAILTASEKKAGVK